MAMSAAGNAFCVPGNHDIKLKRKLEGRDVTVSHGLDRTLAELDLHAPEFRTAVRDFIDGLVSHYVFDDGRLPAARLRRRAGGRTSRRLAARAPSSSRSSSSPPASRRQRAWNLTTVSGSRLVAFPSEVITVIEPVFAPGGTTATMAVVSKPSNDRAGADAPPANTTVADSRLVPLMRMVSPGRTAEGASPLTTGGVRRS